VSAALLPLALHNANASLSRSLKILNAHFQTDVLLEQDPWATPEKAAHLLQLLPDKNLTAALEKKWDSSPQRSSTQKWADIDTVASVSGSLSNLTPETLVHAKQDIRLEYTYPRLDAEVSKKLNHLLKSPFVIHPGTGRVCVPIDVRRMDEFEPANVPTVQQLLSEIDSWTGTDEKMQDWQKTSLKPYVELFRDHVNAVMKEERAAEKRGREESGEGVDF
jgi:DNA primase small subunit